MTINNQPAKTKPVVGNWYIYTIALFCGAAVLSIEILGTRVLGPFYGVTIYLWSALITVTLLALSIGYVLGGRLADKNPSMRRLCTLIFVAGILILLIPLIKRPVLLFAEPLGLRVAVLVAALILFSVPLTLLGMVSPLLIKIRTTHLNVIGSTVGGLYAISTIGSVASALCTGYLLIPYFGVNRLLLMTGLSLAIVALPGLLSKSTPRQKVVSTSITTIIFLLIIWRFPSGSNPEKGLLLVQQSAYGEIRIIDKDPVRYLLIDGVAQTLFNNKTWDPYSYYVHTMHALTLFHTRPADMLQIGLGGGSLAKLCTRDGFNVEAVEIDPAIIDVARNYCGLETTDASIFCTDGRSFLEKSQKKYDVVAMDAFGSGSIPFHLLTKEYFGLVKAHLRDEGYLIVNTISLVRDDPLIAPLVATLKSQFKEVWAFPVFHPATRTTNSILFAADFEIKPPVQGFELDRFDGFKLTPAKLLEKKFLPDYRIAQVLTDDLNPAELWCEQINLSLRRELHGSSVAGVSW